MRAFYVGDETVQMLLRDFKVYGGTIFLEPKCVVVKGGRVEEKVVLQDELFLTGLRTRMGLVARLGTPPMILTTLLGYLWKRVWSSQRTERKILNPHPLVMGDPNPDQRTPRMAVTHHENGRHQPRIHPHLVAPRSRNLGSSPNQSRRSLQHN